LRRLIVVLVVVLCAAAAYWIVRGRVGAPPPPEPEGEGEKVRVVTLYFGSPDGTSVVAEQRTIPSSEKDTDNLRNLVESLISGPREGGTATLPSSVRLRGLYLHEETAVIDFSAELVEDFSGGTTAEYMLVASLVQTICANFPRVEAVRILVEGEEIESLGGHLSIAGPLRPQQWR
jgi:spore germination protein GerM